MKASREISLPRRERVAVLLQQRSARLAALHDWRFWRRRPKITLLTLQLGALLSGSIVLLSLHWTPWVPLKTLRGHAGVITSVSFSNDGKQIVSSSEDHTARIWDLATGKEKLVATHDAAVRYAILSPDGLTLATTRTDGPGSYIDAKSGEVKDREFSISEPRGVAFSRSGKEILWYDDRNVLCRDAKMKERYIRINRSLFLDSAQFSPDGRRVITAGTNGEVRVWDLESERWSVHLSGDSLCFQAAAFSPDGRYIATSGKDGAVRLWEAIHGKEKGSLIEGELKQNLPGGIDIWYAQRVALMKGHSLYVLSSQFSPDGSRLATASLDGTVRIWDGKTGEAYATLSAGGAMRNAAFSPDGERLVAGGTDGVIRIFERSRPEGWIGLTSLGEFWLMILLGPAFIWSVRRDRKIFAPKKNEIPPKNAPAAA